MSGEAVEDMAARAAVLEARVAELEAATRAAVIGGELKAEAVRAGMVDLDGLKLADLSAVTLDDRGAVVGAAAVMAALRRAKPWLFGAANSSSTAAVPQAEEIVHHPLLEHLVGRGRAGEQLAEVVVGEQLPGRHRIEIAVVGAVDLRHRVHPQRRHRVEQRAHRQRVRRREAGRRRPPARPHDRRGVERDHRIARRPIAQRDRGAEGQHPRNAARRARLVGGIDRHRDQRIAITPSGLPPETAVCTPLTNTFWNPRTSSTASAGPAAVSATRTRVLPPK